MNINNLIYPELSSQVSQFNSGQILVLTGANSDQKSDIGYRISDVGYRMSDIRLLEK